MTREKTEITSQRLDKWLWYVRLVKTRSLATKLVTTGKVRVNETKVTKASSKLVPGDVVTAMIHHQPKIYKVLETGTRRGPASEAASLYEDLSPPPAPPNTPTDTGKNMATKEQTPAQKYAVYNSSATPSRERGTGRPTKKDRRAMDKFSSKFND